MIKVYEENWRTGKESAHFSENDRFKASLLEIMKQHQRIGLPSLGEELGEGGCILDFGSGSGGVAANLARKHCKTLLQVDKERITHNNKIIDIRDQNIIDNEPPDTPIIEVETGHPPNFLNTNLRLLMGSIDSILLCDTLDKIIYTGMDRLESKQALLRNLIPLLSGDGKILITSLTQTSLNDTTMNDLIEWVRSDELLKNRILFYGSYKEPSEYSNELLGDKLESEEINQRLKKARLELGVKSYFLNVGDQYPVAGMYLNFTNEVVFLQKNGVTPTKATVEHEIDHAEFKKRRPKTLAFTARLSRLHEQYGKKGFENEDLSSSDRIILFKGYVESAEYQLKILKEFETEYVRYATKSRFTGEKVISDADIDQYIDDRKSMSQFIKILQHTNTNDNTLEDGINTIAEVEQENDEWYSVAESFGHYCSFVYTVNREAALTNRLTVSDRTSKETDLMLSELLDIHDLLMSYDYPLSAIINLIKRLKIEIPNSPVQAMAFLKSRKGQIFDILNTRR